MRLGVEIALAASFCVFAPMTGMAGTDWQTIHAAGDPNITIDIPADVNQETGVDAEKGQLMAVFASAGESEFVCLLYRDEYSQKMTRKFWAAALRSSKIVSLCEKSGANISEFSTMGFHSTTTDGLPTGSCVSSYTDSNEKKPGAVYSRMTIAGPKRLYSLICIASAEGRDAAEMYWETQWKDVVAHIQTSLHLPAGEK